MSNNGRDNDATPNDRVILSWPWHANSPCRLLYDGSVFLPRMMECLAQAQHSIDIELYIFESGQLCDQWITLLEQCCARGVRVRLLIDSIGSEELREDDLQRLRDGAISLREFNPPHWRAGLGNLIRDHRKLVLIDNQIAYVGGMGVTDDCDPRVDPARAWLDAMVEIRGDVVGDWQQLFEQSWQLADDALGNPLRWRLSGSRLRAPGPPGNENMARVNASRGGRHTPLLFHLSHHVTRAQQFVWLNTPYFFPPRRLVRALKHAARKGASVEICTAGPITDHPSFRYAGQYYYRQLLQAGVHIYEFQPRFAHVKAAIVDDWNTIGSCNYDRWNNHWNLDANIEVRDPTFNGELMRLRQSILAQSVRVTPEQWRTRSWTRRLRQAFWFWFGTRVINLLRTLRQL